ncbi:vesicular inhibitory amino acid transporter-like [Bombina bombina]|uniref:vesicular inhibitory amino acid transporter-like n=1 Tax=Bombina bombina TaxID=8345 RepID=UPI00235AE3E5|nr:vesicular inhibitory amino acid transporter-like [Bombina bombina]
MGRGIFVLGLPYAVLQSGFCGILLIILSAVICCYTGKILISCLYEENKDGHRIRVRNSYQDIAKACCQNMFTIAAGTLVSVTQLFELIMTCILYLLVSGNLLSNTFPSLPLSEKSWSTIVFVLLLPCVLIKNLKIVSKFSLLCSLTHFAIILIIITYCLTQIQTWSLDQFKIPIHFENFSVSVGVIIFSYTSQIFLPSIEGNMINKTDFDSMLTWTHVLACILKTLFSLAAFLTWGGYTKEVICDNLPTYLEILVNLCLLTKALLSYPLPFYAALETIYTSIFNVSCLEKKSALFDMLLRTVLLVLTFILAIYIPHFVLLMGLTGSVTGSVMALILPALFHLKLKQDKLTVFQKSVDIIIIFFGFICGIMGIVCFIKRLFKVFQRN